jgi:hypothetical protein
MHFVGDGGMAGRSLVVIASVLSAVAGLAVGVAQGPRIAQAFAAAHGEVLRLEPSHIRISVPADIATIAIPFRVGNRSWSPVAVSGATATCGCVSLYPMPLEVPPGEEAWMTAVIELSGDTGAKSLQQVRLNLDTPALPVEFVVEIARVGPVKTASSSELRPVPVEGR